MRTRSAGKSLRRLLASKAVAASGGRIPGNAGASETCGCGSMQARLSVTHRGLSTSLAHSDELLERAQEAILEAAEGVAENQSPSALGSGPG